MKINLLINNPSEARNGYVNVDPAATLTNEDSRVRCELHNLDPVVCDGEASELVALDILNAFPGEGVDKVLSHWLNKLGHGGIFAVSVVDFREVARAYLGGSLTIEQVNALIHGTNVVRKASLTLFQLVSVLETKGLKILQKKIENYRAVVVAQRP